MRPLHLACEDAQRAAERAFAQQFIDRAGGDRLCNLLCDARPPGLYRVTDRKGISVAVVRTTDLTTHDRAIILRFRLAQHPVIGFVGGQTAFVAGWEHEPVEPVSTQDVHVVAGCARTGEILWCMPVEVVHDAPAQPTPRSKDRLLFPVEEVFGWDLYERLCTRPDLPVLRVRELTRFVKDQSLDPRDERARRALVGQMSRELAFVKGALNPAAKPVFAMESFSPTPGPVTSDPLVGHAPISW